MHILGYGFDLNNKTLNKKLVDLKDNSINQVLSIMEQIKRDYGIRFSYEDIKKLVNANHNLGRPDLAKEFLILMKDMISCGLQGIEVYHSSHTKKEMNYYLSIATEYGLLVSGGSDFHGKSVKPDIELGTGKNNNIKIKKLSLLDKLEKCTFLQ